MFVAAEDIATGINCYSDWLLRDGQLERMGGATLNVEVFDYPDVSTYLHAVSIFTIVWVLVLGCLRGSLQEFHRTTC